jgi:hypothetical protein
LQRDFIVMLSARFLLAARANPQGTGTPHLSDWHKETPMEKQLSYLMWQALGGLIGYAAARYRGFSPGIGAGFGFFAGPAYAWVLFLINGIFEAREMTRCPLCREWILSHATVCRDCGRTVAPLPPNEPGSLRLVFSRRLAEDKAVDRSAAA